jgi:SAM-dependent methyltransferase
MGAEYETILREGKELVLNIGAGASATRFTNCVEFEHKIFRHTDVVGDAHHLPFRDQVFDRVFAFNVFEHLRDPKTASAEIFRVLKPSGSVAIHTAFLQPLHEEPAHFYNATAYGVREWFKQFEIERCHVSGNFSPAYMLAFLMANLLETVREADPSGENKKLIGQTSLGQWAHFWEHRDEPPPGFDLLQNLPQHLQQRVAAGFELVARKPTALETK